MTILLRSILAIIVVSFLALPLTAQVTTGTPAFGSFDGGPDIIDLANLNSHLTIPVIHKAGRGTSFTYDLSYDSSVWYLVTSGGTTSWQPVTNFGWRGQTEAATGYISYQSGLYYPEDCTVETVYNNFVYHDNFGLQHSFGGSISNHGCDFPSSQTLLARDASGLTLTISATYGGVVSAHLTSSFGAITNPPLLTTSGSGNVTDRNGNQFTIDGSGHFYDTLSSTTAALTVAGTPPSNTTFTYSAPSASASYTMKYTTKSIRTNFGCSSITDYGINGTTTASLVTEIDLPDYNATTNPNSRYTFTYEPTPGHTGFVTGRLATVTLPTGGSITYTYTGGSSGNITCADGSTPGLTRVLSDGASWSATWTYARTPGAGAAYTTTVTDPERDTLAPSGNQTVIQFQGIYETERQIYQGLASGTLLQTIWTCFNGSASPCNATAVALPITQVSAITQLDSSGLQSKNVAYFNTFGLPTETDVYDYGSGAPGSLLKKTLISYASLGNNINASQQTVTICNGIGTSSLCTGSSGSSTGTVVAQTQFNYDETAVTGTTGTPQHGAVSGSRGNLTTVKYLIQGTSYLSKTFSYYDTGNVKVATDPAGAQTTYTYGTCGAAFPTQQTTSNGALSFSNSMIWDCNGGLPTSTSDTNSQATNYAYDLMWRVNTVTRPDTVQLTYQYPTSANPIYVANTPVQTANSIVSTTKLDGLGRPIRATISDSLQNAYSIRDVQYDAYGRAYKLSNPYKTSAQYWTTTQFDALGRILSTTEPDSTQTTYSYSGGTTTVTDPALKQGKYDYDSAGRIVNVWEADPTQGNSLTLKTSYTYTALDQISTVAQGVQSRSYNYDSMGRPTSMTTPEAAQITFQYNTAGLTSQRIDARGVQTNYVYDGSSRLIGKNYVIPQGSTSAPMPNVCNPTGGQTLTQNVCLFYDQGGSAAYALGRLTKMADASGSESYTFDQLGRTTQVSKVIGSATYNSQYQYNLADELTKGTYPSGRVVQGSYDAIGEVCAIGTSGSTCSSGSTYATGFSYNPAGQLTSVSYGNGVVGSFSYTPDRLQRSSIGYAKGSQSLFAVNYWYKQDSTNCASGATGNNGQIQCITDSVDSGRSLAFGYDALYRVTSAITNGSSSYPKWGLTWSYDRYGNRLNQAQTAGSPPTNSLSFANPGGAQTNHPDGMCFDASGNLTAESGSCPPAAPTYVYDGENRLVSYSSGGGAGTYLYDGNNLRVQKSSGGTTTVYIFSGSKAIAEYDNGAVPGSPSREYIYSGTGLLAKVEGGATTYFHNDHISARVLADSNGNIIGQRGHYPFADTWYETGTTTKWKFTSYERDGESTNDYALNRSFVNRFGRFSSPDPLSGVLDDPQSLNRYAYALNDPCNHADPLGLASTCTLNVNLKSGNGVSLSDADKKAITNRVNSILSSTQVPSGDAVQIQSSYTAQTDYTLTFSNVSESEIQREALLQQFTLGEANLGSAYGSVYPNVIHLAASMAARSTMSQQMLEGGVATHELIHMSASVPDQNFDINNLNIMMMDTAPKDIQGAALGSTASGLWSVTQDELKQLYADCIAKHPPKSSKTSRRGGGGAGIGDFGIFDFLDLIFGGGGPPPPPPDEKPLE